MLLEVVDDVVDANVRAGEEHVHAEQYDEHVLGKFDNGSIGQRPKYNQVEDRRNGDRQIGASYGADQRDEQIDARHAHGEYVAHSVLDDAARDQKHLVGKRGGATQIALDW